MQFRETQVKELEGKPPNHLANVTTVNLTKVQGGVQSNVIPPQMTLTFDMRLAIDVDHDKWVAQLNQWCEEAGGNIEIFYEVQQPKVPATKLDDSNKYWVAFKQAIDEWYGLNYRFAPFTKSLVVNFLSFIVERRWRHAFVLERLIYDLCEVWAFLGSASCRLRTRRSCYTITTNSYTPACICGELKFMSRF